MKWEELGYDECTWESEEDLKRLSGWESKLKQYTTFNNEAKVVKEIRSLQKAKQKKQSKRRKESKSTFKQYTEQPACLAGGMFRRN